MWLDHVMKQLPVFHLQLAQETKHFHVDFMCDWLSQQNSYMCISCVVSSGNKIVPRAFNICLAQVVRQMCSWIQNKSASHAVGLGIKIINSYLALKMAKIIDIAKWITLTCYPCIIASSYSPEAIPWNAQFKTLLFPLT